MAIKTHLFALLASMRRMQYGRLHHTLLKLTMSAMRASYSISPEVLLRFNEVVPASERSSTVQSLMESILSRREQQLEAVAAEFESHPDFAVARADSSLWDATLLDGLANPGS